MQDTTRESKSGMIESEIASEESAVNNGALRSGTTYQMVFRIILPLSTDEIIEDNVRRTVFDAVSDTLRAKQKTYPDLRMKYKLELTSDYVEVI